MKIRTIYFKVTDMSKAVDFWQQLLDVKPHKTFSEWHEFMVKNLRLGLLLAEPDDKYSGSNCVPVFEFSDDELTRYIERAKVLGAKVIVDGLNDPNLLSIVFSDPFGNEFELSKFHD
jgi:predicted enzyme related to lactoylglutathione lyase